MNLLKKLIDKVYSVEETDIVQGEVRRERGETKVLMPAYTQDTPLFRARITRVKEEMRTFSIPLIEDQTKYIRSIITRSSKKTAYLLGVNVYSQSITMNEIQYEGGSKQYKRSKNEI